MDTYYDSYKYIRYRYYDCFTGNTNRTLRWWYGDISPLVFKVINPVSVLITRSVRLCLKCFKEWSGRNFKKGFK